MSSTIRELIRRDISVKVEGVVKVFDRSALATELHEYVLTDKIEEELKRILDTYTSVSDTLRRGGHPAMYAASGFPGSSGPANLISPRFSVISSRTTPHSRLRARPA